MARRTALAAILIEAGYGARQAENWVRSVDVLFSHGMHSDDVASALRKWKQKPQEDTVVVQQEGEGWVERRLCFQPRLF